MMGDIKIMTKLFVALILVSLSVSAYAQSLKYAFNHLSRNQISVLKDACRAGITDNLCYTMSAIAWQESDFGLYIVNFHDKGAGIYGNKVSSVMDRLHPRIRNNSFNRNRVGSWLIHNSKFAATQALLELKYWLRYWHNNWFNAVGSYNGGYRSNRNYAWEITKRVRFLERHIKY